MIRILCLLTICSFLWACNGGESTTKQARKEAVDFAALGFQPDSSGLWWRIAEGKSQGDSIRIGDSVRFLMKVNLVDGSPISTPQSEKIVQAIKIGQGQVVKGVELGLCKTKQGDKAEFILPPHLAYGSAAFGAVQPNSTLRYSIEVVAHIPSWVRPEPGRYPQIKANGVMVYVLKEGQGAKIQDGDSIRLSFAGYLENGQLFDRSLNEAGPLFLPVKKNRLMPGLYRALTHIKRGSTVKAIIPPDLGFGKTGLPPKIPANSTLYFDLTVE